MMQAPAKGQKNLVRSGIEQSADIPLSGDSWQAVLDQTTSVADLCDTAAARLSVRLGAQFIGVWVRSGGQHCQSAVGDPSWIPLAQGLAQPTEQRGRPRVRLLDDADGRRHAVASLALDVGGRDIGSVVAVIEGLSLAETQQFLEKLQSLIPQISRAAERLSTRNSGESAASPRLTTLAKAIRYESLEEFCCSIANGLRVETDTDLVAVGLVDRNSVQLSCISGLDELAVDSPGSQVICRSMEEALDSGQTICIGSADETAGDVQSDSYPLTSDWQRDAGGASVASIPLTTADGRCAAVVSVQGRHGKALTEQRLQQITDLALPLVPAIELMKSGQRSLIRHALDSLRDMVARFCGPISLRMMAAIVCTAATTGWLVLGTMNYIVHAPCMVVAARTQVLSAPWEAPLGVVLAGTGDRVQKGQLLAQLDTRRLLTDRDRVVAEMRAAHIAVVAAAQRAVPADTGRALSRWRVAEAELEEINLRLTAAEIRAPFDGQIVSEDLHDRAGQTVPIGEVLFEIVPDGELALELKLPETVLAAVTPGQAGSFAVNASPGSAQKCRLEHIDPAAEAGAFGNVVSARAAMAESSDWLRPGMQGMARITTGSRPVWWVWLHRVVDELNYRVWSLSGSASADDAEHSTAASLL